MMKHFVDSRALKHNASIDKSNCVVCCEDKQSRYPFPTTVTNSIYTFETVDGDVRRIMKATSIGGTKYFLYLVDDYSRILFDYFLETKSQAFEFFK